jgi:hypothetical protein
MFVPFFPQVQYHLKRAQSCQMALLTETPFDVRETNLPLFAFDYN